LEAEVQAYVNSRSEEQTLACLTDTRTSDFYSQLIDIELKKYRAAIAHSALVLQAKDLKVPEKYASCTSYQSYVEQVVANEQERRMLLKQTLRRAQNLLSAIKVVAQGANVQDSVLEKLKLKVSALQENYRDATASSFESPYDLCDLNRDDWW
jgi:phage shock protein A